MTRTDVAIAIVCRQRQVLICRRNSSGPLAGYWEFPGGKVEPQETITQCLTRELREELDIEVDLCATLPSIDHDYPDVLVRLHPFLCALKTGLAKPIGCRQVLWIDPPALRDYQFPPANKALIDELIPYLASISQSRASDDTGRSD